MHLQTMLSWSPQIKLPYSGLENLPKGTNCPNVIGGCGNKQGKNKTRQLYKSNFPSNMRGNYRILACLLAPSWSTIAVHQWQGKREKAQTNMENLKPIPGEPKLPTGQGLKWGIQRHLLLGRYLYWAPCPKSYFNHWKFCSCCQGSPVKLPKHRHLAPLETPQPHCLLPSSCFRWTSASLHVPLHLAGLGLD